MHLKWDWKSDSTVRLICLIDLWHQEKFLPIGAWLIYALHKEGPKDLLENYRPISLTSVLGKILEHIVSSGISNFLESNNILTPHQHGFRRGHSCTTQLINAVDDWAKATDYGYHTDVVIFDFSKAFDSVPYKQLLYKLQY